MHDTADTQPPTCPDWCEAAERGWQPHPDGSVQVCHCEIMNRPDCTVELERHVFLEGGVMDVADPVVSVCCYGLLDLAVAAELSAALGRATELARHERAA